VGRNRPGQFRVENERLIEVLVRGSGEVTITAESDRAGKITETLTLA
jgi:hypothetical protein